MRKIGVLFFCLIAFCIYLHKASAVIQPEKTLVPIGLSRSSTPPEWKPPPIFLPVAPIKKKEALSLQEKRIFYAEVQHIFLDQAPHALLSSSLTENIIRINERGFLGVEAIFEVLEKIPQTEKEGRQRIAYVDYLKYRMRWDPETVEKVKTWILDGSENEEMPNKSLAMILADKTELVEGLARTNQDAAREVLASVDHKLLYELGAQEVFGIEAK